MTKRSVLSTLKEQEGDTAMLFVSNCLVAFGKGDYREAMRHIDEGLSENPETKTFVMARVYILKGIRVQESYRGFSKSSRSRSEL